MVKAQEDLWSYAYVICYKGMYIEQRERVKVREREALLHHSTPPRAAINTSAGNGDPSGAWTAVIPWKLRGNYMERETKHSTAVCYRTATAAQP